MSEPHEAGRALDALIATQVMGLTPVALEYVEVPSADDGEVDILPYYSTHIAAAWRVIAKMRADDWRYQIAETELGEVVCWFFRGGVVKGRIPGMTPQDAPMTPYHRGVAASAPLAICRAAIAACPAPSPGRTP